MRLHRGWNNCGVDDNEPKQKGMYEMSENEMITARGGKTNRTKGGITAAVLMRSRWDNHGTSIPRGGSETTLRIEQVHETTHQ